MSTARHKALPLVLPLMLALVVALVWLRPLDPVATDYTEAGLKRAFATFAVARALNAGISVLKSGEVNVQVGAGASLQVGAVLDPLDDLVEQFSAIMLAATLSFATQRLLIEVSGATAVSIVLTVAFLAWGALRLAGRPLPGWLPRLAIGLLCLRFAVPVAALGSEATYRVLLSEKYEASQAQIGRAEVPEVATQPGENLADTLKRWWSQGADVAKKIEVLKARAGDWVDHIVRLAAVFIVQTIVLPLLLFWLMLRLYRVVSDGVDAGREA
jgi:hypothetical protein